MSCKYLTYRTQKYNKYIFCRYKKEKINFDDCKKCEYKEYKKQKSVRGKKHKRTKETDIPKAVKLEVWERDLHKCIFCETPVPWNLANAHFIKRSAGGLGIPENIFTACENCHREQDNGLDSKLYTEKAKKHLNNIYGANWHIENLCYKKYK